MTNTITQNNSRSTLNNSIATSGFRKILSYVFLMFISRHQIQFQRQRFWLCRISTTGLIIHVQLNTLLLAAALISQRGQECWKRGTILVVNAFQQYLPFLDISRDYDRSFFHYSTKFCRTVTQTYVPYSLTHVDCVEYRLLLYPSWSSK